MSQLPHYPPSPADFVPPMLHHTYFQQAATHPFPSRATASFDPVAAWWLAEAALLAYAAPGFVATAFRQAGFDQVIAIDQSLTGTQGYVASNGQDTLILFRGTEIRPNPGDFLNVIQDMATDLFFPLAPAWTMQQGVHAGFLLAFESIWPDLQRALQTLWSGTQPPGGIWVTGHSLGGALASLAAPRLQQAGYPVRALYTFAAPRAGDKRFARSFSGPAFRVMLADDLVPDLPPWPAYFALGTLVRFDRQGQRIVQSDYDPEARRAANRRVMACVGKMALAAADPALDLIELPFLADHSPLHYALIMAHQI